MAHLSLTLCILAALCVSITHSWLNEVGWGHKCRNLASKDGNKGVFNVSPDCQIGTVEWHYPQYDSEGLEITWTKGTKVCILTESTVDLLKSIATSNDGQKLDLRPLSADKPQEVCAKVNDGKLTLKFLSDVWTYVQVIDYRVD